MQRRAAQTLENPWLKNTVKITVNLDLYIDIYGKSCYSITVNKKPRHDTAHHTRAANKGGLYMIPQTPKKNKGEIKMTIYDQITAELEARKDRSAWDKGVNAYALDLVEEIKELAEYEGRNPESEKECREWMLNGAQDWEQYSWGGSALIYDGDIAERLCCPSELKKTRNGERRPNSREEWLDIQARALYQACNRVARLYSRIVVARGGAHNG